MISANYLFSPRMLGIAFFLPFIISIGFGTLLIWAMYSLVGLDPSAAIGGFVGASLVEVSPIFEYLLGLWLIYFVVLYAPIAYTTADSLLLAMGRAAHTAIVALIRRFFTLCHSLYYLLPPVLSEGLRSPFRSDSFERLSAPMASRESILIWHRRPSTPAIA